MMLCGPWMRPRAPTPGLGVGCAMPAALMAAGGRAQGRCLTGAQADTAALAPVSGTPAAQRALITTLHARLAQQQHLVNIYHARDVRLAALLRATHLPAQRRRADLPQCRWEPGYSGRPQPGVMPVGLAHRAALRGVGNTAAGGVNSGTYVRPDVRRQGWARGRR